MSVYYELPENDLYMSYHFFDFDSFNNWLGQSLFITGTLENSNTLNYTNRVWNIQGTTVTVNGVVTFNNDFTSVTGEFTLTGGHTGTISFFATL